MNKQFKDWLDTSFSPPKAPPNGEWQGIAAGIEKARVKSLRQERIGLVFCVLSISLTVFVVLSSSRNIQNSVTNYNKQDETNENQELYREYDVSLETLDKILHSTRQM